MRSTGVAGTPLPWLAALLAIYLLAPLVAFLVRLAGPGRGQLSSPGTAAALWVSVQTATVATAVIAVLGVPLAYLLARGRRRGSMLLGVVIQLPIALPPLMSGILLLYLVGPYGPLGRLFGGRLTDDVIGVVVAQVFVAAPFLVVAARSAFAALDPALEEVAATLGHHRWSRFSRVAVPAAVPGIVAGLLLAWLRAFGEFGATVVLAYHPYSLPVFTYVQFGSTGLPATLLPVAVTLGAAFAVLGVALLLPRLVTPRRFGGELPAARPPGPVGGARLSFDLTAGVGSFRLHAAHDCASRRLAILGASGAGKTLTLRLLAGLAAGTGRIRFGDADLAGRPAEQRDVGYLPQESSLLPQLEVWRQVTFGVGTDPALAAHWLGRLGLAGLAARLPGELSGGQRRRVALARALAREPALLLLDEPLTGLDTTVRQELRRELRELQRDTGLATVLVTHDPEDAALLADEVLVLDHGRVLQAGAQAAVFRRPASVQVARLMGWRNLLTGRVAGPGRLRWAGLDLPAPTAALPVGARVAWSVPPTAVSLGQGGHPATVRDVIEHGGRRELELSVGGGPTLLAEVGTDGYRPGSRVSVRLDPDAVLVWPAEPAAAAV